jgi:hypothetical protein
MFLNGGDMKASVGYTDIRKGSKVQKDTLKSIDRNVQRIQNGPPCAVREHV